MAPLHAVLLPSVTRVKAFLDNLVTVESAEGEWAHRAPWEHCWCRVWPCHHLISSGAVIPAVPRILGASLGRGTRLVPRGWCQDGWGQASRGWGKRWHLG